MREISPAENATCEEYLALMPDTLRHAITLIRKEKNEHIRPAPSACLIDKSNILKPEIRRHIVDQAAILVDENLCGRSEMCQQYAVLVSRALNFVSSAESMG